MPSLASDLRKKLERVVIEARDVAETGARAALEALAVHHHEPYPHMEPQARKLRNQLRARARQLGDRQDASGRIAIDRLVGECAYEHWHRMLFARFLAENNLLIEPEEKMAISLLEAEELAKDQGQDVWDFASRCAQDMLPQIFRPEDPLLQVSYATEHRVKSERLLSSLPGEVFTASDALGWVYQFWQTKKKKQVNDSEVKIGADEIPAVTQLFTEPYMVEFLLHNTLGAWWAGKKLSLEDAQAAESEEELRSKLALPGIEWGYLRLVRGEDGTGGPWRPAAGKFDGWPKAAKELKLLDPCCGSGHFLVAALNHLVPIRMAEENVLAAEAVDAVLRDNLHGLEIDERCCQIAAFALALAAWTYPDGGGYRELPALHIACTGIGPQCSAEQWLKLAEESSIPTPKGGSEAIRNGLLNLHHLFSQAQILGSLIDPTELPSDMFTADYDTLQPYLTAIMKAENADDDIRERAVAAAGMVRAADLLAGEYSLVITNVPYLLRAKQCDELKNHLKVFHELAKHDLATAFVERCLSLCSGRGTTALVCLQNWLFLSRLTALRGDLLMRITWDGIACLGPCAFEAISGEVVSVALMIFTAAEPNGDHHICGIDVETERTPVGKAHLLCTGPPSFVDQALQLTNPSQRLSLTRHRDQPQLAEETTYHNGFQTGDQPQFVRCFWEIACNDSGWVFQQSTVDAATLYGGLQHIVWWEGGRGRLLKSIEDRLGAGCAGAWIRGLDAWGNKGVTIRGIGHLPVSLYLGTATDNNVTVLIPKIADHLPAIWAYCSSPEYSKAVRRLNKKFSVTDDAFVRVPFDLSYWQNAAAEMYPSGIPEPESDDPTQWLFHGRPDEAQAGKELHVAVARRLGYRWPAELDPEMRLSERVRELVSQCETLLGYVDDDGIVCIPSVRGEEPAAEQLRALLSACDIQSDVDLDDWLRNKFFEEHCDIFHQRPFIWHIWDGRKRDGFHALVNYHKLAEGDGKGRRLLESLTYAYLGDWITRQRDGVKQGEGGADDRLAAALELQKRLEAILAGEPPFDIFVRWKPLHEQPIGWEPDINDGVRVNIRPFLASDLPDGRTGAGVLRCKPNIKWKKDRGKEPERPKEEFPWFWGWDEKTEDFLGGSTFDGNRWNDCHYTNKVKQAAREGWRSKEQKK